jgi:D-2-hydroxyacid dehydrogenase (NADP+)
MTRRVGVHESIGELFPVERFERAFASGGTAGKSERKEGTSVEAVGSDPEALSALDVCLTLAHEEAFLESDLPWVHSVQAGVDRFPA